MTELLQNIYAVEVPKDASNFKIVQAHGRDIDLVFDSPSTGIGRGFKPINGNYSFICASLTATEEEAMKIFNEKAWDWEKFLSVKNNIAKLSHLLHIKGLNTKLNYAIIKKLS